MMWQQLKDLIITKRERKNKLSIKVKKLIWDSLRGKSHFIRRRLQKTLPVSPKFLTWDFEHFDNIQQPTPLRTSPASPPHTKKPTTRGPSTCRPFSSCHPSQGKQPIDDLQTWCRGSQRALNLVRSSYKRALWEVPMKQEVKEEGEKRVVWVESSCGAVSGFDWRCVFHCFNGEGWKVERRLGTEVNGW